MRLGRIGGALVLLGCFLLLVSAAIAVAGGSVRPASTTAGGIVITAALGLLSAGAIVLGLAGARPLDGAFVRIGLGLIGIGTITVMATSNVSVSSMLVVVYLVGGLLNLIGAILTEVALLASPGEARRIGIGVLAGLVVAMAAGGLVNVSAADLGGVADVARVASPLLALVAGGIVVGSVAALGLAAIRASGEIEPRS